MAGPSAGGSFEELIQSRLFTFYVGKEKKAFVVHSKAIEATSDQLYGLLNNGLAESQTESAELSDVKPDDFARFVEYAYRCDYTVPPWVVDASTGEDEPEGGYLAMNALKPAAPLPPSLEEPGEALAPEPEPEVDTVEDGWDFAPPTSSKKKKSKHSQVLAYVPLRSSFDNRKYLLKDEPRVSMLAKFEHQSNTSPEQNFTSVFLAHAWLYTFASMRFIEPLKRLALHKLHRTLLGFQPYDRRIGDVVELARYAYEHGEDRRSDGTIEPLRKLVVEYMAREVSSFGKHKKFVGLLEEGGEFAGDFWCIVYRERLS